MTPDDIRTYFARAGGQYQFARWNRPIVPVVFGDHCLDPGLLREALVRLSGITGHPVDLEAPPSAMTYGTLVVREWRDLAATPGAGKAMPGLAKLGAEAERQGGNQFRTFQRDWRGGIKRCVAVIRTAAGRFDDLTPESMALRQAALSFLHWSIPGVVKLRLVMPGPDGVDDLKPEVVALLRAAYDPAMPVSSRDPRHADQLAERMGL